MSETKYPSIEKSNALWKRSVGLIPAGTQTLAKGPGQWTEGVAPKYLVRGQGSHVWDVDGNEYVDLTMAVGPLSLGYCYPAVDEAIKRQLADGITFSLMHPLEVEVAELVREVVPNTESVRFSKTGCDVTTAAVRLARAYTKRDKVLCCGYHGWHDWYIGVTDRNAGIPKATQDLTYTIRYNDLQSVEDSVDDDTACIILEPMVFEAPKPGFLEGLREICDKRGILLIFDEMWTGFRLALGGAQEAFGVRADLACFSKAIANGMPISVLSGRADVMKACEKDVFFFTTFGGEALSLAAAKATIETLREKKVPEVLAEQGKKLREGYLAAAAKAGLSTTTCFGYDARTIMAFKDERAPMLAQKTFVQQEMLAEGVLWGGFHNVSYSHGDVEVGKILSAYERVLAKLAKALEAGTVESQLRGKQLEPVFRRTENFNMKPKAKTEGPAPREATR
jgi:glutamate-1-semialdehyde aminotransferase